MRIGPDDRLVAAFAPFALYGPALGIAAAVPDMDVTRPGHPDRHRRWPRPSPPSTPPWSSPPRPPCATSPRRPTELDPGAARRSGRRPDRVVGRGARPGAAAAPRPGAAAERRAAHPVRHDRGAARHRRLAGPDRGGPATGRATASASAGRCPASRSGSAPSTSPAGRPARWPTESDVTGEICVAGAHVKDHYDRLWATERQSSPDPGWHRTGDVGHLDTAGPAVGGGPARARDHRAGRTDHSGRHRAAGRGRRPASGPRPRSASDRPAPSRLVMVVVPRAGRAADRWPTRTWRRRSARPPACRSPRSWSPTALPVDIRHASKVDRLRLARWAERVLGGGRRAAAP